MAVRTKTALWACATLTGIALLVTPRTALTEKPWAVSLSRRALARQTFDVSTVRDEGLFTFASSKGETLELNKTFVSTVVLDYARKVAVGNSVNVTATVKPGGEIVNLHTRQKSPWPMPKAVILSLAGADVQPPGNNALMGNSAIWSVRPAAAGQLNGFVAVAPSTENGIVCTGRAVVSIAAYDHPFGRGKLLSWIPKFLGSALTLPGLLALIMEVRKSKGKGSAAKPVAAGAS